MSQFKGYGTTTNCSSGADTTNIDKFSFTTKPLTHTPQM